MRFDGWMPLVVGLTVLAVAHWDARDAWWFNTTATYCLAVAASRSYRQWQLHKRADFDAQNPGQRHMHMGGCVMDHPLSWSLAFLEFPVVFDLATEFGFLATFAVPSISAILVGSDSFGSAAQKRESVASTCLACERSSPCSIVLDDELLWF